MKVLDFNFIALYTTCQGFHKCRFEEKRKTKTHQISKGNLEMNNTLLSGFLHIMGLTT
ncbi:hypothetical protein I79_019908 [Cricetulus griseus]|uniref:Uncharacterized protein n=1 Tax=Cricetulus griseus TaxID=10029 RepID=G3I8N2_CRIGR|nr:hypothetical protein I79_019908 [Cricetulus griseus]